MSASQGEVVEVRVGKQVRRADGKMMEEIHTTTKKGNQLSTTTAYRVVGGQGPKKPAAADASEAKNLKALLGEEEEEEATVLEPAPRQTVQRTGDNPTMDKLVILKQLLEEEIISKAEFDLLKKQVIDEMMAGGGVVSNPTRITGRKREESPETARKVKDLRYAQDYYKDVYANGKSGEGLDKNPTMMMQPTGVDGVYYTGKAPEVVDRIEEQLPDR